MKPLYIIFAAILCCFIVSCSKNDSSSNALSSGSSSASGGQSVKGKLSAMSRIDSGAYSIFIPIDSANKMLTSYLMSIPSEKSETTLRCITFSADSLRAYLSDPSVKSVKFMFAHKLQYINSGHNGQDAGGLQSNAITIIVAGYNANGDYTYHHGAVLDHGIPCPSNCIDTGSAASYTLP
ncbi:hypothetical protein ACTHGU_19235 [Chitinophagaceae bacterium MMS25-I14]